MDKQEAKHMRIPSLSKCEPKSVEAYLFIDPLCMDCWGIEPVVMKLWLEYGKYFSIRHILTGKVEGAIASPHKWNKPANIRFVWEKTTSLQGFSCDGKVHMQDASSSPYLVSIAIKAAELQGRKAGSKFLRKLQEYIFLENVSKPDLELLLACAEQSGIDVEEFKKDLHSTSAKKAFQCDLKFTNEMHITEIPSLVFFHANSDEEGIKIAGIYSYDVYVQLLKEIVKCDIEPAPLPPLEVLLETMQFMSSKEIAFIYDCPQQEIERELKKLSLKRKVRMIEVKCERFWKWIAKEKDLV
ncbi:DsbA family protein [Bacillus sp. Xin]|uniref:ClpXP adapter SpxH family protein n=1 Tax=unclassified Bacillus (in: firmicutes) TaxID=185979 RepID=UPI001572DA21|nr:MULTISPECIES: ClpXP adapter SpxH family protein [unclassified Bacillus (in: firmicutes)]MBC6975878.1 DsbA family protein [Bacillus sp. Xin]NSW35118.1 DsbA family protein [Bacillus sp. Xin1]